MKMDILPMSLRLFLKLMMKKGATRKQVSDVNVDVKKLLLRPTYNATVNNTIPVSGTANIAGRKAA